MIGAFSSEWVKLRRRAMLVWGLGGGLLFALLATIFTIERAVRTPQFFQGPHGIRISFAQLEMPDGLVHGVVDASALIGIVALCLFAGAFSTEYSQGTMRNLLVREPRRALRSRPRRGRRGGSPGRGRSGRSSSSRRSSRCHGPARARTRRRRRGGSRARRRCR